MKGSGPAAASAAPAGKRQWQCVVAAGAAVARAFFSVVVPLTVLLGLHSRFPSMYLVDESVVSVYGGSEAGSWEPIPSTGNVSLQVNNTVREFVPPPLKPEQTKTNGSQSDTVTGNISIHPAPPIQQATMLENSSLPNLLQITNNDLGSFEQGLPGDENGKSCQLQFGSYCLWSVEHKEVMKDFIVKRLKDQLFVARAYYPSIVKLDGMEKLSLEMKQNIQEHGHMLSEAISDADLPELRKLEFEEEHANSGRYMVNMKATFVDAVDVGHIIRMSSNCVLDTLCVIPMVVSKFSLTLGVFH